MESGKCYVCKENNLLYEHHVSYYPEETVDVCASCHAKIHRTNGFRDDLEPERERPEGYKGWVGKERECVVCGETGLVVEMYPANIPAGVPGSGKSIGAHEEADVSCSSCTGRADSYNMRPVELAKRGAPINTGDNDA